MQILQAFMEDAKEILYLRKSAYRSEAERYQDYNISPLTQTIEGGRGQFEEHVFLKAVFGGKIVGTVRAYKKEGTCYIGRLAADSGTQGSRCGRSAFSSGGSVSSVWGFRREIDGSFIARPSRRNASCASDAKLVIWAVLEWSMDGAKESKSNCLFS